MEFYLKDCITGEYKGFTSMKDLARFWLRKFDKRFDQLNLTETGRGRPVLAAP